jgi:hypothetical protein
LYREHQDGMAGMETMLLSVIATEHKHSTLTYQAIMCLLGILYPKGSVLVVLDGQEKQQETIFTLKYAVAETHLQGVAK